MRVGGVAHGTSSRARKALCGTLMLASVALAAGAYRLADHPTRPVVVLTRGDLVFYPLFSVAVATFMTAWIAGWMWEGVLGDKRRSLRFIYLLFLVTFIVLGLGAVAITAALGKGEIWVENLRGWPIIVTLAWQAVSAARKGREGAQQRGGE